MASLISLRNTYISLTNPHEADLSLCLAQFLDAQVFLGDTAVSGALVAPGKENLNHSKDS